MKRRLADYAVWLGILLCCTFLATALVAVKGAFAQHNHAQFTNKEMGDYGYQHEEFHDWYQQGERGGPIMRPHQPTTSCCNGDCRPARAKLSGGSWHVYIDGIWVRVPPERIKVGIVPPEKPFRSAHVCASKYNGKDLPEIYCFILNETES